MKSKFFTVSQACNSCANAEECRQRSDLEQELCQMDIIRGGYGDWNKVIDLVLTKETAKILVDVIEDYISNHKDDSIRYPVLQSIRARLRFKMR